MEMPIDNSKKFCAFYQINHAKFTYETWLWDEELENSQKAKKGELNSEQVAWYQLLIQEDLISRKSNFSSPVQTSTKRNLPSKEQHEKCWRFIQEIEHSRSFS